MAMEDKYDGALLGILQNEGKIAPFLDMLFGFLYRRTDFFRVMHTEKDKLGFPPGVAFKLLENIFKKYEMLASKESERVAQMKRSQEIAKEMEVESAVAKQTVTVPESQQEQNAATNSKLTSDVTESANEDKTEENTSEDTPVSSTQQNEMECDDKDEEESPESVKLRRELQSNPLTYNGAETEKYYWSQTITETDVRVKVPKHIKKGRQLNIDIKKKHLHVSFQDVDNTMKDLLDGELSWEINTEESMWTLNPGEFVHINLEKKQERWWECVLENEPKINTRKIDCSRPMTDLDDEAQAKIEEMMYNQKQKQLGLPQSHEQKTHDMLRKAWDAEGSPFKGQTFDPSKFSIDSSGIVNMKDPASS